jgi:hypothetical protein
VCIYEHAEYCRNRDKVYRTVYACEPIFYLASFKLNTTSVLKVIQFYVWDESNFLKFN